MTPARRPILANQKQSRAAEVRCVLEMVSRFIQKFTFKKKNPKHTKLQMFILNVVVMMSR